MAEEIKMQNRDQEVHFFMTRDELHQMYQKMEELGVKSKSAYLRKMALDGYCISLDTGDIKDLVYHLRRIGNNLNQYARRANESGSIYVDDIKELQTELNKIWEEAKEIIGRLATIQ